MTFSVITLGCKVNSCESAAIESGLERGGFERAPVGSPADIYVINSCAVTGIGERKTRHVLSRCKKENPACVTVVCGCLPQAYPEGTAALGADIVTGNSAKGDIPAMVREFLSGGVRCVKVEPLTRVFDEAAAGTDLDRTRAFIKVEDGCDRFCTYCIIPTARGRVRSRKPEDIAAAARSCAESGHKEIVLTGINLGCYGQELGFTISDAVRAADTDGIVRIRLGSLEPEMMTDEEIARLAAEPKLCPHFHLSLQSGCDETLKRMCRRYDTEGYARMAEKLRAVFPECSITTDVMVGFAGETDEEFEKSLEFVERMGFAKIHVFPYSIRKKTVAAERDDQVFPQIKTARARAMEELGRELERRFLKAQTGKECAVLIEKRRSPEYLSGFTANYTPVRIYGCELERHTLADVRIAGFRDGYCIGVPTSR